MNIVVQEHIFKVYKPLFSTEEIPPALVRSKDETVVFYPPWEQVKHLFLEGETIIYMHGTFHKDNGRLILSRRAPKQDW